MTITLQTMRAASLAALLTLGAAGLSSAAQTQTFNLSGFSRVSSSAGVHVIVRQGPFSITAQESQDRFDLLEVSVRGDTLVVSRKNTPDQWFGMRTSRNYTVNVSAPAFSGLNASSGSSLTGQGVSSGALTIGANSGATLRVSGTCGQVTASASSGATLDGRNLRCRTGTVHASSGATVRAFADTSINGSANSGGSVTVHGSPKSVEKQSSSGGSVRIATL